MAMGTFTGNPCTKMTSSMKQETHKCRFFIQMLIWRWRWRCGSVNVNPWARMRMPCRVLSNSSVFRQTFWFSFADCSFFCQVFQGRNLRKYPRQPCGSLWCHLELWRLKFDWFPITFPYFAFVTKSMKIQLFLLFLEEEVPKPRPTARSRGEDSGKKEKNSSARANLTDLVTTQVFTFCGCYLVDDNQGSR